MTRRLAVALAFAAIFLLAACSSSDNATSTPTPSQAGSGSSTTATAGASATVTTKPSSSLAAGVAPAACSLLTPDEVSGLIGHPVAPGATPSDGTSASTSGTTLPASPISSRATSPSTKT